MSMARNPLQQRVLAISRPLTAAVGCCGRAPKGPEDEDEFFCQPRRGLIGGRHTRTVLASAEAPQMSIMPICMTLLGSSPGAMPGSNATTTASARLAKPASLATPSP